jgi:serine/threonine protein kinase
MAASEDDDVLSEVARTIADDAPVSWDGWPVQSPSAVSRLEKLRLVEQVARAFRSVGAGPARREDPCPREAAEEIVLWGLLRILEKLGEGGYGEVYRAHDLLLDRPVALKLRRQDDGESDRHYMEEARRLARVHHPNVLLIHGADVRDGRVGLWTELIEGQTLEERLTREGPLDAVPAAAIGLDLCRALTAIHAQGLLHGDVKTSNVMCERGGRIVLMDFGAAGDLDSERGGPTTMRGTPLVLAPEILRGGPRTAVADVYSLGVLLYRLLTGRYPVEGDTLAGIVQGHRLGPTPLGVVRPGLPAALVQVVERALDGDPRDRFATAADMGHALERAHAQQLDQRGLGAGHGA